MKNNNVVKIVLKINNDLSLEVAVDNFSTKSSRDYEIGDIYFTEENGMIVENWVMN